MYYSCDHVEFVLNLTVIPNREVSARRNISCYWLTNSISCAVCGYFHNISTYRT